MKTYKMLFLFKKVTILVFAKQPFPPSAAQIYLKVYNLPKEKDV